MILIVTAHIKESDTGKDRRIVLNNAQAMSEHDMLQ